MDNSGVVAVRPTQDAAAAGVDDEDEDEEDEEDEVEDVSLFVSLLVSLFAAGAVEAGAERLSVR